jgi:4-hydroxy-tetrahydrodipicolinate synthase
MTLSGCGTALVTPFRGDGSLDEKTLRALVDWQIQSGIQFLVACGTTAETPTLTHEEWLRVIGRGRNGRGKSARSRRLHP